MSLLHALRNRDEGVTLAELMAALAVLLVLVAIAVPTFFGAANSARDTESQAELHAALSPLKSVIIEDPNAVDLETLMKGFAPSTKFDVNAVAGIKLERSLDGAICMWRISMSGAVYGVWEPPAAVGATLYAEFPSLPVACPVTADAPTEGYTLGGW